MGHSAVAVPAGFDNFLAGLAFRAGCAIGPEEDFVGVTHGQQGQRQENHGAGSEE